ncbi:MAG: patatin-like phospholipase family protein [Candidatus Methylomirabilia bacterium]
MATPVREWVRKLWRRGPTKSALALAGGGVIGGMYEVGALAALEESLPGFKATNFDIYVGSSAGAVVATLVANGVSPLELYQILDQGLPDPMNFEQSAVYDRHAVVQAARRFLRLVWAVGSRHVVARFRSSVPDLLSKAQGELPPGFFSLEQLEEYIRRTLEAKGLSNDFRSLARVLLIPAVDLDRAERVVFGLGELAAVPISQAVAASSAIPGFFEPYTVNNRDHVDGGVGHTVHADLAIQAGAELVVVVNPLVPVVQEGEEGQTPMKQQGLYSIMEQSSRIINQRLFDMGLRELKASHPKVELFILQPDGRESPLFGPSMGFAASRAALRFGHTFTKEWLASQGATLTRRFALEELTLADRSSSSGSASAAAS